MSHAIESSGRRHLLRDLLTTDFCPWANRFVYWLKEPIGWFALAAVVSLIVGQYFSPIGWTLAASLLSIMAIGMAWPLIAIHVTNCELRPDCRCVHEGDPCRMRLTIRNRILLPIWGLAVEGFLDADPSEGEACVPTVALACVPPASTSQYHITVRPQLRGHYPIQAPSVTCSFPFGIWTARRKLPSAKMLTVWPKVYPVTGTCPIVGTSNADHGEGQRGGRTGDFVGVRAYRRGDSAKQVNWVASARVDSLIITERGGPQSVQLEVCVDTKKLGTRDQLADRIRVAASILLNLHQSSVPMQVKIGSQHLKILSGPRGRRQILDALSNVPADGVDEPWVHARSPRRAKIEFTNDDSGRCKVNVTDPARGRRAGGKTIHKQIGTGTSLAKQVESFWREVRDGNVAA